MKARLEKKLPWTSGDEKWTVETLGGKVAHGGWMSRTSRIRVRGSGLVMMLAVCPELGGRGGRGEGAGRAGGRSGSEDREQEFDLGGGESEASPPPPPVKQAFGNMAQCPEGDQGRHLP